MNRCIGVPRRGKTRLLSLVESVVFIGALLAPVIGIAAPAAAAGATASFNVQFAKNGTALVLTVNTTSDTNCVEVTGPGTFTDLQAQASAQATWTFNDPSKWTAGAGNGTQSFSITALKNKNCNGAVTGTASASYVLDNIAPTISASRSPGANANGWNNTDVTVHFTCSDGGSGIATCPSDVVKSTSAANQTATGQATDNAGNSASASITNINIDKVSPTLSGAPTTSANGNGWYKGDVVVAWSCSDGLSGIQGSCPANTTITGEGTGLTSTTSVSDKSGNTTTASSTPAVNIDRHAPTTTASSLPVWNKTNVTVVLTASDALSGIAVTHYILDNGTTQDGTSVPISNDGIHTLDFWSVDKAGNVEATHEIKVQIDGTPPTITHTQSPLANANGWNNSDVTVTFICGDATSGVASCNGSTTVATEGKNQPVTGMATDNAGNTATDPASVSIDKTKPTISATRTPAANANGWNNSDVTVTFACNDDLSGVDTCSAQQKFGEGANQSATGTVTDAAGNSAATTLTGINVDETKPTITGAPTTPPNANGWYNGDVTIHWTCSDALSGLALDACPADSVITSSGTALTASASVTDRAGNTATATSPPVQIDRVAPSTTSDAPSTWQNNDVVVHLNATDNYSGVAATYYSLNGGAPSQGSVAAITQEGATKLTFWSVDKADNTETAHTVTILLDKSDPTISHSVTPAPNGSGWNNSDVTVAFSCADAVSGVASCSGPTTLHDDGAGQLVKGTAVDNANNSATDTATVNLDETAPTISGKADRAANAHHWYNADVTVSFDCNDATSGVASCPSPATLHEGSNQSVTGTAFDKADNSAQATVGGINIDETPPTISGAPTTSPNINGWYKHDVTVEWTCSDTLSQLAQPCPAPSTITGEGSDLSANADAIDNADNTAEASVNDIHIDQTAPATTISAPGDWVNSAAPVDLTASDNLSGVAATYYSVDGGSTQQGTSFQITSEGTHSVDYWSVDNAGNEEQHHTATVKIDLTAPTISHQIAPSPNGSGWNNTDVTVTFTCADQPDLSGLKSCTSPQSVTQEGANQSVSGLAVDNAGNTTPDNVAISLDKTPPSITASRTPDANLNDWVNSDVTVKFACGDTLSGVAVCPSPVTLGEGKNQSVTGTAYDNADNHAAATVDDINVDETPPTITGKATTDPNANGWYNGDVTIHWTCHDDLSGLAAPCPPDSTISGEGDNLSASASISDLAGNSTTAMVDNIKIDRTAPVTTSDAPTSWKNADVTVSLHPTDNLSLVEATHYKVDGGSAQDGTVAAVTGEGKHTLEFWSVDFAGNEEVHNVVDVLVDKTAPSISHTQTPAPNSNGWNNTSVEVGFKCDDALSGVATCPDPTTLTAEGKNQTVTGTAFDNAGNPASDTAKVNIDETKPTITAAPDRGPDSNGWYNADVHVTFTCFDALSGIDTCPGAQTLGQGVHQSATGTAVDQAGNSADAGVSDINVDETKPTISGAPTTSPDANGWYSSDVTIHWTCSDALSGLASDACPADSVITGEGDDLNATASVTDIAGNTASATVEHIKIDRNAPATTVVSAPSDWVNSDATVTLDAHDNLSGVAATYSSLDNAAAVQGTTVVVSDEGDHSLSYWSVDNAGNVEPTKTIHVKVDKTAPTITDTHNPVPNGDGWNNTDVTVTFSCDDSLSLIQSCTSPVTTASAGKNQPVVGIALDNAGNSAQDQTSVSIDKTKPTISAKPDRDANGNGWYNADVTVSFSCADDLSGVEVCSAPATLGEGADQSATGSVADAAGNSNSTTLSHINVDKTPPTITGAPTTSPNANGWYNGDVIIRWTCTDPLSGIAAGQCPADSTVSGEGDNLSATASTKDRADNTASATVDHLKIDRTAPVTTTLAPSGWQNSDVTLKFTATDNRSGVAATYYQVGANPAQLGNQVTISTEGTTSVAFWSVDAAGNKESHETAVVQIDKTNPTISGAAATNPNGNGWYNSPVVVHFSCSDALAGISSCTSDVTLSGNAAGQSVTGKAVDNAGNSATATVSNINIDMKAPTVNINGVTNGGVYPIGAVPTPSCSTVDALSGQDGCSGVLTGGLQNGVGTYTYKATGRDRAGNTATASATFQVQYVFSRFLQPVNDTAHQTGLTTSVFKAGSTVPVKFRLTSSNGALVTPNSAPRWVTPVRGAPLTAAVDESAYGGVSTTGDTYRTGDPDAQYIYNWSTKGLAAGYYYRVGVQLDDGTTYTVNIGLR